MYPIQHIKFQFYSQHYLLCALKYRNCCRFNKHGISTKCCNLVIHNHPLLYMQYFFHLRDTLIFYLPYLHAKKFESLFFMVQLDAFIYKPLFSTSLMWNRILMIRNSPLDVYFRCIFVDNLEQNEAFKYRVVRENVRQTQFHSIFKLYTDILYLLFHMCIRMYI